MLLKNIQKLKEKAPHPNLSYKTNNILIPKSDSAVKKTEQKPYLPISLMIMDIEILNKIPEIEFSSTLKRLYNIIR